MDIRCPLCAEPWDTDELHDVVNQTYDEAYKCFRKIGCATFDTPCSKNPDKFRAEASAVLMDLLGDDVDGVASMLDDFEYAGLLDVDE
jgi:hypothetical protein